MLIFVGQEQKGLMVFRRLAHCVLYLFSQPNNEEGTTLIPPQKVAGEPRGSMISASFNFINSIIGSGIIGRPKYPSSISYSMYSNKTK